MHEIDDQIMPYLDRVYRISKSHNTKRGYKVALRNFNRFLISKKELNLIAEMIVKSGAFSDWENVFAKKPELAKFMLDNPEIMNMVNKLTGEKNND